MRRPLIRIRIMHICSVLSFLANSSQIVGIFRAATEFWGDARRGQVARAIVHLRCRLIAAALHTWNVCHIHRLQRRLDTLRA